LRRLLAQQSSQILKKWSNHHVPVAFLGGGKSIANAAPVEEHVRDSLLLKQLLVDQTSPSVDTVHYQNGEIS
jgi:hypothetical protein